jgi:3,4-dihydroxy 2-butanone 4-phosphate synthase/GTP cyclohydrolase II
LEEKALQTLRGLNDLRERLSRAAQFRAERGRPLVVLSYAQSLDGSIAGRRRERVRLSGPESLRLTHAIRGLCDAILVGVGTVIADDPRLALKYASGRAPQPVVLDTRLRTPVNAALLGRRDRRAWIVHGPERPEGRLRALAAAGCEPIACATGEDGWIDLGCLMARLGERSIDSLMVEGGARVITSFSRSRLVDLFVITISPRFLGGLPPIDTEACGAFAGFELERPAYEPLGRDLILWAAAPWSPA